MDCTLHNTYYLKKKRQGRDKIQYLEGKEEGEKG